MGANMAMNKARSLAGGNDLIIGKSMIYVECLGM